MVNIPFTNGADSKRRPILLLWLDGEDVVAAAVTSAKPRSQTDVFLKDCSVSGFVRPLTVRLSRLDCLEKCLLLRKIGQISQADAAAVKQVWELYVKPQF